MKGKNYRVQDSCRNCASVFEYGDYDGCPEYYCNIGKTERPLCGSIAMDEDFEPEMKGDTEEEYKKVLAIGDERRVIWEKWAEGKRVHSSGICDEITL